MIVAFDVDGTLITNNDEPRYEVIDLLRNFNKLGCTIFIWSGGGIDYATRWKEKLGLTDYAHVIQKGSIQADLAVDDFPSSDIYNEQIKHSLGKVLLKV